MSHIIAIQSTYHTVDVGLYDGIQSLDERTIDKKDASAQLMHTLEALCSAHKWRLLDVQCIVVNQGPGPFTTLRTVIASVNGLSFATGIPLLGINALEALIVEFDPDNTKNVLALLNAFGNTVYYGIRYIGNEEVIIGTGTVAQACASVHSDPLHIIGNGAALYGEDIRALYGETVLMYPDMLHASLKTVAHMGIKRWRDDQHGAHHLSPLYLKNYIV